VTTGPSGLPGGFGSRASLWRPAVVDLPLCQRAGPAPSSVVITPQAGQAL